MKVVQVTHHHGDFRYGMSRGVQCSCISLMSVCWTLFKSTGILDFLEFDCILQKVDLLFKSLNNYICIRMEDLPQKFWIEDLSINVEFLNNRTGEITVGGISCVYY